MPFNARHSIYSEFLFSDFLSVFRKLFTIEQTHAEIVTRIRKQCQKPRIKRDKQNKFFQDFSKMKMPSLFYDWSNHVYAQFMINLLDNLEPRFYDPGTVVAKQQLKVIEKTFVVQGAIKIGFTSWRKDKNSSKIRQATRYVHAIGRGRTIGFEMLFDLNAYFTCTTSQVTECFAIRKTNWRRI